jgi:hypothetical protein
MEGGWILEGSLRKERQKMSEVSVRVQNIKMEHPLKRKNPTITKIGIKIPK